MAVDSQGDVTAALKAMGWRCRTSAERTRSIKDYQRAWNLGPALKIDGVAGPATMKALTKSMNGGGLLSAHFKASEFDCTCGGKYSACRRIWPSRHLLSALETYRSRAGSFSPVSGCRCPSRNVAVGGASKSQHLAGYAVDVPGKLTVSQVRGLHLFGGIGYKASTGKVIHVDIRAGSRAVPVVWRYA